MTVNFCFVKHNVHELYTHSNLFFVINKYILLALVMKKSSVECQGCKKMLYDDQEGTTPGSTLTTSLGSVLSEDFQVKHYKEYDPPKKKENFVNKGRLVSESSIGSLYDYNYGQTEASIKIYEDERAFKHKEDIEREMNLTVEFGKRGVGLQVYDYGVVTSGDKEYIPFIITERYSSDFSHMPFNGVSFYLHMSFFKKAALAIKTIHDLGLAHNNVKPDNLVVMLQIHSGLYGHVRLRNFEYVQDAGKEYTKLKYDENDAPELDQYNEGDRIVSSQKVDIYQLTLCLFYLLGFHKRYRKKITEESVREKAAERSVKEENMEKTVTVLTRLLQTNLDADPEKRTNIDQLIEDVNSIPL